MYYVGIILWSGTMYRRIGILIVEIYVGVCLLHVDRHYKISRIITTIHSGFTISQTITGHPISLNFIHWIQEYGLQSVHNMSTEDTYRLGLNLRFYTIYIHYIYTLYI